MTGMAQLKITLVKSRYGRKPKQRATLKALGLNKINKSVVQEDNPVIRGMIGRVQHLVMVEPLEG